MGRRAATRFEAQLPVTLKLSQRAISRRGDLLYRLICGLSEHDEQRLMCMEMQRHHGLAFLNSPRAPLTSARVCMPKLGLATRHPKPGFDPFRARYAVRQEVQVSVGELAVQKPHPAAGLGPSELKIGDNTRTIQHFLGIVTVDDLASMPELAHQASIFIVLALVRQARGAGGRPSGNRDPFLG